MSGTDRWNLDGSGAEPLKGDDPTRIGPVPLLGRLGAGGMGRVYLGLHEGQYVAVKQVLPSVAGEDEDFVRRFGHELDNLDRLPADSTAALVLSDLTAGPPWFATAYVPGLTLRQAVALNDGALSGPALWLLLREAAAGLAAVHDLGMVHRDVKPSNVMLTVDGATLIDFGVARAADQSELTLSGKIVGTPAYMSPEQASGHKGLDSATDVFALGSVLTFAACGRPPFGDESGPAVLYRVVHEAPDTDALRIIDTELAEIVTACLDKVPEKRPSAADLLRRIEGRVPVRPPLWPPAVTEVLERRAAFARTRPAPADLPDVTTLPLGGKGGKSKNGGKDGGRGGESKGGGEGGADGGGPSGDRPPAKTRTRVLFGVMPVVVVVTGATLAFRLLPYALDRDGDPEAGPSASVTVSAAGPEDTAGPSRSASKRPSPSASRSTRAPGPSKGAAAPAGATGGGAAGGGTPDGDGSGDGGSGGGSSSGGAGGDPPPPGGFTLRNAATGDCVVSSGSAAYGYVNGGSCTAASARWSLRSVSAGTYRIVHRDTGGCLDAGGSMHTATCGGQHQTWRFGSGGTVIVTSYDLCLEHVSASGMVMRRNCSGVANQSWSRA